MASDAHQQPGLPKLPIELQYLIIGHVIEDDLPAAWGNIRQVNYAWRKRTERLCGKPEPLSRLRIEFGEPKKGLRMELHRISDDGERVVYRPQNHPETESGIWDKLVLANMRTPPMAIPDDRLPHLISIEHVAVNDTELVGFRAERATREVSFLWKPTLAQFLGEEFVIKKQDREGVELWLRKGGFIAASPTDEAEVQKETLARDSMLYNVGRRIEDDRRLAHLRWLRARHSAIKHGISTVLDESEKAFQSRDIINRCIVRIARKRKLTWELYMGPQRRFRWK